MCTDPKTGIEKVYPVTESYVRGTHMMMLGTDFGYLDIFDFVPGLPDYSVAQLVEKAISTDRGQFVSLMDLRRMKTASGRNIDLIDLEKLPPG